MKIAFILNEFPTLSETFILNQVAGVLDAGHELELLAIGQEKQQTHHTIVKERELLRLLSRAKAMRKNPLHRFLDAYRIYQSQSDPLHRRMLKETFHPRHGIYGLSLRYFHELAGLLPPRQYDLVHCQFGNLFPRVLRWYEVRLLSGPLVLSLRGKDTALLARESDDWRKNAWSRIQLCLPVCQFLAERAVSLGCPRDKIQVLRSGIEFANIPFTERDFSNVSQWRILSVNRLVEKKGISYGLRALARLKATGVDFHYTIVGFGPLKGELEREAQSLGLQDQVTFHGAADSIAVHQLLKESHLFLAPCVTAKDGDIEGIPNSLKEAMASGVVVISTRHSGIPELVEHEVNGFLAEEKDVAGLVNCLKTAMNSADELPRMGKVAREKVAQEYDMIPLNQQLLDYYQTVFSPNKA